MSRPYKMTEEHAKTIAVDFYKKLMQQPLTSDAISYSTKINCGKAKLLFTPVAALKQSALVRETSSEIGWHGVVLRDPQDDSTFIVKDILVYPQKVTGASINPDQLLYNNWLDQLDDDTFNALRFHGHSHVNMATFSSSVDDAYQKDLIAQLSPDMFQIFLILNKRGDHWQRIVDLQKNVVYDKDDITIGLTDCGFDYAAFVKDSAGMLTPDTTTNTYTNHAAGAGTYAGGKEPKVIVHPSKQISETASAAVPDYPEYDDESFAPYTDGYFDEGGIWHRYKRYYGG